LNLFVVDENLDAVVQVDSVSGNRSIVSDNNMGGSGILFSRPVGITLQNGSEAFVVDRNLDAVLSVDLNTGNRQLVSGCSIVTNPCPVPLIGSGLGFGDPVSIVSENATSLLVTDIEDGHNALVRVNMVTGSRTIVSSPTVGRGPALLTPIGVTSSASGEIYVIDEALDAVVGVDPVTGARQIVSGCPDPAGDDPCPVPLVGSGTAFLRPVSIAPEANNSLVVTDLELGAVVRIDIATGNRAIISDTNTGQGEAFFNPVGIAVDSSGMIFVVDASRRAVFRVDPVSGDRTLVSKQTRLTLSPPDGVYTSGQNFDFAVVIDGVGAVSNLSMTLDGNDVTGQFMSCQTEMVLSDGGTVLLCPDANLVFNLQPGRRLFRVGLSLDGVSPTRLSGAVMLDILATQ
jgi:hypothetical protein